MNKLKNQDKEKPAQIKEKEVQKETVKKASENTVENIVKNISELKLGISGVLDKVEDELINEFKRLNQIHDAILIEQKNLQDLYQISTNADSLAAMLMAQREKKEQFEKEISEKKKLSEEHILTTKTAFENDMIEKRGLWDKEKKDRDANWKEEDELSKKQRKREEEEYIYTAPI
jgi:hypothetical protein